ncbi:N-ethylmaleimide reductase [Neisseriaceae bacterium PsAf]|nr:N-ethylmaleimide reductase [Neisseriaceae bacterium PsAf]
MSHEILFTPVAIGNSQLKNRIVMAPLTRLRSIEPGDIPSPLAIEYYSQRASAGLIITEATNVSAQAKGYQGAPGIHTDEQQAAWKKIVDSVHAKDGKIAVQLWHTGSVSHKNVQPNHSAPISASAVSVGSRTSLRDDNGNVIRVESTTPREASLDEIKQVIIDFANATQRAKEAGFDFVEIHGAHGYLLAQFWSEITNQRQDEYGDNRENRARLTLEVLDACIKAWDKEHVGIRISPMGEFNNLDLGHNEEDTLWIIEKIAEYSPAYLHISESDWVDGISSYSPKFYKKIRQAFNNTIIAAGGYDVNKAEKRINDSYADAVAFGRAYIANPDLVERFSQDAPLNESYKETIYGGDEKGYIDYPILQTKN